MQQRIEMFYGNYIKHKAPGHIGSAFDKAKAKSDELIHDGWFVHQMLSERFVKDHTDTGSTVQVIVVYRRKV